MRDTPMIDSMMKFCFGTDEEFVRIKDAAKLERELNASNERIKRLEDGDAALTYSIGLDLQKENEALKARIQRLEQAGDALYENSCPTRWDSLQAANRKLDEQQAWRKSKEAKP